MRIRALLLLLPCLLATGATRARTAETASLPPAPTPAPRVPVPYRLRLDVDIGLFLGGLVLWGGTSFVGAGSAPPSWCGTATTPPCDPSGLNALDRAAVGLFDPRAHTAADVITGVVPGALTVFDLLDAGLVDNWRGWLADAVVISEAVVWDGAVQDIVRRAVRRPRPYMYTPGLNPTARDGPEANFSFFSGHTSGTFAMATATAMTYSYRHPGSKWQYLVWTLALAGATTEPILRVLSGDHFPVDCIVGAMVGTASGSCFPRYTATGFRSVSSLRHRRIAPRSASPAPSDFLARAAKTARQKTSCTLLRRRRSLSSLSRMKTLHALVLFSVAAGCANTAGNTDVQCRAPAATSASRLSGWTGTVFTIVMENHSRGQIFGNSEAPFINQLANQNAVAAGYHDSFVHPSEPNYLWLVAGENFGILNDNDPGSSNHVASTSHIADQLERAGLTWKIYQESMGAPCGLSSHGEYAAKHNPFIYFDDINGWDGSSVHATARCIEHVVDYSQLDADLAAGSLADYVFITPNLQNDMHDGSVDTGDAWLAREVPKLLGSPQFNQGGVLFLLWDEGGGFPQADDPPFIAISSNAKPGYVSQTDFDSSSYLKTVQTILGVDPLPCSPTPAAVQTMAELFTMPMPQY